MVFITAPLISLLFDSPQITTVIRVLALNMPIGALTCVQNAFIQRQMAFRKYFVSSMYGTIFSRTVGVFMALKGFGVWALVGQSIISSLTNSIVLFIIVEWHPKWMFSWKRFKKLFYFGWRMAVINFLATFSSQLKGYVIGYKYSSSELTYYNRGEGIPGILSNNICVMLDLTFQKYSFTQLKALHSLVCKYKMKKQTIWGDANIFKLALLDHHLIYQVGGSWGRKILLETFVKSLFCRQIIMSFSYYGGNISSFRKIVYFGHKMGFLMKVATINEERLANCFWNIGTDLINTDTLLNKE